MIARVFARVLVTLSFAMSASVGSAESPPPLRFDPFRSPPEAVESRTVDREDRGASNFQPVLRSVVVAGNNSLANLGGEILKIGEVAEGYRLVAVRPFEAVFEREGERLVLAVSKDEAR